MQCGSVATTRHDNNAVAKTEVKAVRLPGSTVEQQMRQRMRVAAADYWIAAAHMHGC